MSSAVSWNLRVSINEGRLEDFRALMQEMVASTEGEAGALGYEWSLARTELPVTSTSATPIQTP